VAALITLPLAALTGCTATAAQKPASAVQKPAAAVVSGTAEPCPGHPAPAPHCWTGLTDAYFANQATLALTPIPAGPLSSIEPGMVDWIWAGDAVLTYSTVSGPDGPTAHPFLPGDLAMYNPATRHWSTLRATPGHPQAASTAVWTGSELLTLTTKGQLLAFRR
jgi:hypothetical protein